MFCWLPSGDIAKALLQPATTLLVGILLFSIYKRTAGIAQGQADVAEAKLNLELFYWIFLNRYDHMIS